jgi:hypothetical protein
MMYKNSAFGHQDGQTCIHAFVLSTNICGVDYVPGILLGSGIGQLINNISNYLNSLGHMVQ